MGRHDKDKQVREKLIARGVGSLSDAELLSIVIREGTADLSAIELSERLLARYDHSLVQMSRSALPHLRSAEGIGITRAAIIASALELGRRLRSDESMRQSSIGSSADVVELFRPLIGHLGHEEFWALYLNNSNRILDRTRISQGGVTGTVVDPKLILKRAIELLATGLIVVHNHPSGNPVPSDEDRQLTSKLAEATTLFNIVLLDHIIVSPSESFSFREHNLLHD